MEKIIINKKKFNISYDCENIKWNTKNETEYMY